MSAKLKLNCKNCGKIFFRYKVRIRAGFCSKACAGKKQTKNGKTIVSCNICGKKVVRTNSKIKRNVRNYCSMGCRSAGKSIYHKVSVKTPEALRIRHSKEYKELTSSVLVRDVFTCTFCGQIGGKLQVDHIKPFAYYPSLRFWKGNLRTLCFDCHKKTPTYLVKSFSHLNPYYFVP